MLYMIWAFPAVIAGFLLYIVLGGIPAVIMRAAGLKKAGDKWAFFHAAFLADIILFLLNVRTHVSGDIEGLKKLTREGKPVCFIANHTSMADILLIDGALALESGFMCKDSLRYFFPFNIVCIALNCVFISRTSLKKSVKAIGKGVEKIKKGSRMAIFPEGTRSRTGEIAPFKHGSFKLAILSGAHVVPITIKGVRSALEDRKKMFAPRTDCKVHLGSPVLIDTSDRNVIAEAEQRIETEIKKVYACL